MEVSSVIFSTCHCRTASTELLVTHQNLTIFDILITKILDVNLFAFAFRVFHEDFSQSTAAD